MLQDLLGKPSRPPRPPPPAPPPRRFRRLRMTRRREATQHSGLSTLPPRLPARRLLSLVRGSQLRSQTGFVKALPDLDNLSLIDAADQRFVEFHRPARGGDGEDPLDPKPPERHLLQPPA